MPKQLKRRDFIGNITVAFLGCFTLASACTTNNNNSKQKNGEQVVSEQKNKILENLQMPEDLVMKLLDQKVDKYMQISFNCAQSSFLALKDQFALEENGIVKALTPLAGIAERGETCGAVIGPLMAFGLIYGRDENRLGDWEIYRNSLVPSGEFCRLFEKEYGSTMCSTIQNKQFGRCYELTNPEELQQFQKNGATEKCSEVVKKAVRIAARIILEKEKQAPTQKR